MRIPAPTAIGHRCPDDSRRIGAAGETNLVLDTAVVELFSGTMFRNHFTCRCKRVESGEAALTDPPFSTKDGVPVEQLRREGFLRSDRLWSRGAGDGMVPWVAISERGRRGC